MNCNSNTVSVKRLTVLILCAVLATLIITPASVYAGKSGKTVRVGWYESSFNTKDKHDRRSGYAYEYQIKLAAYTGWKYEYVNGSWSELLEMLKQGKIDMMSDVSYTDERAGQMLFPQLPMGTEEYYIFTAPNNKEITSEDYSSLNGKKVGVNKGSIQADYYREWAKEQGVDSDVVELTCEESKSLKMLQSGKLDAYVTPDAFGNPEYLVPVCKIGSSNFFFAVNKDRKDLLNELNNAMSSIQDENRYYNQQMSEKYLLRSGVNAFLTAKEKKWLKKHGPIKVGYQDNYLAFCAKDKDTGELTGALKNYLEEATRCLKNAKVEFKPKAYDTAEDMMQAMKKGEIDCVFPVNFSSFEGESREIVMTPPMITTDVVAVVRASEQKYFANKKHVVVAVNEGNPNYDAFLLDNYPDWRVIYYPDTSECLKAVGDGLADCVLISSYRFSNISRECEQYNLANFDTGIEIDYSFAVSSGKKELYTILSRITGLVPASTINSQLAYYFTEDAKSTFVDFFKDNIDKFLIVAVLLLMIIAGLMVRSRTAERKAKELIAATETDTLTGLYTREFFLEYATRIFNEHPDVIMDAIVVNIEQFHSVNAINGREFGDQLLRTLGSEIMSVAKDNNGIAGRFGADRFDIFCKHTEDPRQIYYRLQGAIEELAPNASIRLRMGVMRSQHDIDVIQMFDMARTACGMARDQLNEHLVIFDNEAQEREAYEQRLLNDYRRALDGFEFEVYYQPKYDIQSDEPKLVGAEALVRWRHPEFGMITPDDFISLFERHGRINEVDRFVWNEAARQVVRWHDMYGMMIPVSVNLSRLDVFDNKLEDTLDSILKYYDLDHEALKLEVTESAYTENSDQVIKVVSSLREKGYVVEMDDFGTGYSSLNMLSEMPVDIIKMDRHFIKNIEHDEKVRQLVALIIDIAEKLKLTVVAEGVETKTQLDMLKELGCSVVQGYYFFRPLSSTEFENMIVREIPGEDRN